MASEEGRESIDVLGVIGPKSSVGAIERSAVDEDIVAITGPVETVLAADPDLLVAVDESAFRTLVDARPNASILAMEAPSGVPTGTLAEPAATMTAVAEGQTVKRSLPVLAASIDGDSLGEAVLDVTLLRDEPAHISEFAIHHPERRLWQFRADGVVVATPAGSHGYARQAGGPRLSLDVDALVAVPIAPFVARWDRWVVPAEHVVLSVERDEGPIDVLLDGRVVETLEGTPQVEVSVVDRLDVLETPSIAQE